MFKKSLVIDMINRSSETPADRRNFLRGMGLLSAGAVGAGLVGANATSAQAAAAAAPSEGSVLNFALNLEYLEAEFYCYAAFGHGLADSMATGTGTMGGVTGGHRVPFKSKAMRYYAEEIAGDEIAHVNFLRKALGGSAVSRPAIDLQSSFTAAAVAAGVIEQGQSFDPFSSEEFFLLGAFLFEDVGVTAYKGAAPLISTPAYLEAAAGILAVEAYHSGIVRTLLYQNGLAVPTNLISDARDALDGGGADKDQGITVGEGGRANLVAADADAIAFSRTPQEVLNIVYLTPGAGVSRGGFYPAGLNGEIATS
ncbi:ferritin-like domain-containing protein [Kineococcus sp. T13]|uniref:ferritin-like domain-containing protein n=1 Tax=Kineococcus vitellinus TaxID=2696565 RepID=UPI0014132188|nr:ferritin-like domain-containing protein [Kineococcus vitellinus]NAZ77979.1 ferritin-like domain-containing protein [Kineococcus vitellinus]